MKARFTVNPDEAGATLAAVLRNHAVDLGGPLPWSAARQLCERGQVRVDGETVQDSALRMRAGQTIDTDSGKPARKATVGPAATLVWEDAHLVVIDKPAGVSSVPYEKREQGTAMDLVRAAWRKQGKPATQQALFVVHRIDKDTSGLLVFAKSKLAERALQALLRAHDMERSYLCVAHGHVSDRRIESFLITDRGDGLRGSTRFPEQGKRAVTHVKVIERLREATLCEVRLETGKTHQIRIHLAEAGHPLVGERVYIRDFENRGNRLLPSPRLLLHAATLGFVHPVSGEAKRFESALPADFTAPLAALR